MSPSSWQTQVYAALKAAHITQLGYVPDAGHAQLIAAAHADPDMRAVVLTTEEEGIALAAGAWLGGQRAVLLMQSSGVGNCINMLSLPVNCRMPFLTLVTMRGEWANSIRGRCRRLRRPCRRTDRFRRRCVRGTRRSAWRPRRVQQPACFE